MPAAFWSPRGLPDGGVALFELAASVAPLTTHTTFDDRSAGTLQLDRTPAGLLAAPETAHPALAATLDLRLVLESAEVLGAMERALELTRDYLLTRKQYGQLIGDFQALRHRLADMFIETEQARSLILRGLGAVVDGDAAQRARIARRSRRGWRRRPFSSAAAPSSCMEALA